MILSLKPEHPFKHYLLLSLGVHLFLLLIAYMLGNFSFYKIFGKRDVKVVSSSVRVDVVSMPRLTIKELESSVPKISNYIGDKDFVKPTPGKNSNNNHSHLANLLKKFSTKKVSKLNKKKRRRVTRTNNKKFDFNESKNLRKLLKRGNKISKGFAISGEQSEEEISEFNTYLESLVEHVRPNWKLPSYLIDKELNCRIRIFLNSSGDLIRVEMLESSGDNEWDNKALQAVRDSAPYPELPEAVKYRGIRGDIVLGFPL